MGFVAREGLLPLAEPLQRALLQGTYRHRSTYLSLLPPQPLAQGTRQLVSARSTKYNHIGGMGFFGWPTSLNLSDQGHNGVIVDNLSRRTSTILKVGHGITDPIRPMRERLSVWGANVWEEIGGKRIGFDSFDVAKNYYRSLTLISD